MRKAVVTNLESITRNTDAINLDGRTRTYSPLFSNKLQLIFLVGSSLIYFISMIFVLGVASKEILEVALLPDEPLPKLVSILPSIAGIITSTFLVTLFLIKISVLPKIIGYSLITLNSLVPLLISVLSSDLAGNMFSDKENPFIYFAFLPTLAIMNIGVWVFFLLNGKKNAPLLFRDTFIGLIIFSILSLLQVMPVFVNLSLLSLIVSLAPLLFLIALDSYLKVKLRKNTSDSLITISGTEWASVTILGAVLASFFTWNVSIANMTDYIVIAVNLIFIGVTLVLAFFGQKIKRLSSINLINIFNLLMAFSLGISMLMFFSEIEYKVPTIRFLMPGLLFFTISITMAATNTSPSDYITSIFFSLSSFIVSLFGLVSLFLIITDTDLAITKNFMSWDFLFLTISGISLILKLVFYIYRTVSFKRSEQSDEKIEFKVNLNSDTNDTEVKG